MPVLSGWRISLRRYQDEGDELLRFPLLFYIINIANTLPHSLAPVLAGVILGLTHSYSFLYIAATIFVLLGIFTVMPIKAVR